MNSTIGQELRRLLSEMSGYAIGDRDYVAYFVNQHGERLVFVREHDANHGVLLHSDLDWEPKLVTGPAKRWQPSRPVPSEARQLFDDVPVVGDVILNHPEALWLKACLAASDGW